MRPQSPQSLQLALPAPSRRGPNMPPPHDSSSRSTGPGTGGSGTGGMAAAAGGGGGYGPSAVHQSHPSGGGGGGGGSLSASSSSFAHLRQQSTSDHLDTIEAATAAQLSRGGSASGSSRTGGPVPFLPSPPPLAPPQRTKPLTDVELRQVHLRQLHLRDGPAGLTPADSAVDNLRGESALSQGLCQHCPKAYVSNHSMSHTHVSAVGCHVVPLSQPLSLFGRWPSIYEYNI